MLVAADAGLPLCGGTLAHMDDFVALLSTDFGLATPIESDRLLFHWVSPRDYSASSCRDGSLGCANPDRILAKQAPLNHELVHALAFEYGHSPSGRSPSFFEEGLAEAFEGLDVVGSYPPLSFDVWSTIDAENGEYVDRTAAAGFVSMLVANYGLETFLVLYSALPPSVTVAQIDQAFRDVFHASLEDSVAEFEAANPYAIMRQDFDAKLMECSAPGLAWDDIRLAEFRVLDCSQEDAVGPYNGEIMQVMRTISVSAGGDFELNVIAERPGEGIPVRNAISLVPCDYGVGSETRVNAGERARVPLAAGLYSLRLLGSATTVTNIGFTITRVGAPGS